MILWIHPSQLIPKCILTTDVIGKTNRPIATKDTVIDETHIEILQRFLIDQVEVATNLENGVPFIPKKQQKQEVNVKKETQSEKSLSFMEHYHQVVEAYKLQFNAWQSGSPIEIHAVRKLIVPLLERTEEVDFYILTLYKNTAKDDYFFHHSVSTSLISAVLAQKLGLKKEWMQIGIAGLLADCGMAKLKRSLFYKEGKLSKPEFDEIMEHPTYSYRFVEKITSLTKGVKLAILQHHERLDGTGYPLGVKEDRIHRFAKIVAICDTYHAMTSERIYRTKQSPFRVIEEMQQDQYQKFDHQILQAFIVCLTNFSSGTKVKLSNEEIAEIIYIESEYPTRPMVRIENTQSIISLKEHKQLYIEDIII
ncbi:HD-GYP domain-containing protein [Paraliobacillus zengyii]|uniref:HD-GYP domain-containing protein n=1 Tax=Paraliobacillus zengyii TaxID=2213194 RepID=UPI001F540B2F|nr:HD-GYP domain-containing protein [Paraliobacillus zengyii]